MGGWMPMSRRWATTSISSPKTPVTRQEHRNNTLSVLPKAAATVQAQYAPVLTLPLELIQQISSYLDSAAAASFCLSSRYIYYAVGTAHLNHHLSVTSNKFERRKKIEILERAFPSHWYCAWCDTFHPHQKTAGPKTFVLEAQRDCAEYNSYLHDDHAYVLCYHHVRLAVNRALWGPEYGLDINIFRHEAYAQRLVGKTVIGTALQCEARVVGGHFILHARYRLSYTSELHPGRRRKKTVVDVLRPALPQVVVGHRDSHRPHTGMRKYLVELIMYGKEDSGVHLCDTCATDYVVRPLRIDVLAGGERSIEIEVWRDLGNGRNPFDSSWRAHGELGNGHEGFTNEMQRLSNLAPGSIKTAFESKNPMPILPGSRENGRLIEGSWGEDSVVQNTMEMNYTQEIMREFWERRG